MEKNANALSYSRILCRMFGAFYQLKQVIVEVGIHMTFSYEYVTTVRPMTGLHNGFHITLMELESNNFSPVVCLCKVWS
jgi:hypothetical protein